MLQNEITKADLFRTTRGIKNCQFQSAADGVAEALAYYDARIGSDIRQTEFVNRTAGIKGIGKAGIPQR